MPYLAVINCRGWHHARRYFSKWHEVVHLLLDGKQPFMRMRDAAVALAASMDGLITDDNGQVIPVEALDRIGADLEHLYDTLDARDLSAGSPQARRLFS